MESHEVCKRVVTDMEKARAALILRDHFFGCLALRLELINDPSCPTAATNGIFLKYSDTYLEEIKKEYGATEYPDYLKGLWAHEVLHNALAHHTRRGQRDPRLWNVACDYAVDQILVDAKYKVPHALVKAEYEGLGAEAIFAKLQEEQSQKQSCPKCGKGQGPPPQFGGGSGDDSGDDPGCDTCEGDGLPQGAGEVQDFPGNGDGPPSEGDMAQQEQEWKVATVQAAQAAKMQGNMPSGLQQFVDNLTDPKVPWTEALARWLTEVAKNDYSWNQPNRRHMIRGIYLPHLESEEIGKIGIFWDTSGSVGSKEAALIISETAGILQEYTGVNILLIHCDSRIPEGGVQHIDNETDLSGLKPLGGGGTNFVPPFEYVVEKDEELVGAIYMTDGECSSFAPEPDFPVIWCLTQKPSWMKWEPPYGETIYINA